MKRSLFDKIVNSIWFFFVPIALFYLMEGFEHNAFVEVRPLAQFYNIFLLELIGVLLLFVTGSAKRALRIEILLVLVFGLVNHYVMEFRSTPFVPWDVFSIRTAASVAGNYDFTPEIEVIVVTVLLVALFIVVRYIDLQIPHKVLWRTIPVGCVVFLLISFVTLLQDRSFQNKSYLYPHLFTPAHMTKVNGMAVTFSMNLAYVYVEEPQGYSVEKAEEILAEYEAKAETLNCIEMGMLNTAQPYKTKDFPNIIVVMNEAFSDLSVLGDFTVNEDYMPFVHRLQQGAENTVTGNLEVSVCGGNTANSEFEFLTGHTMDYFPMGSVPFQQYITKAVPSLASQLKECGYETYGMHPYNSTGWKRNEVYPLLGLDTNYFVRDFENREYIRDYVSDASAYDKIIEVYENRGANPVFVFEVTMQNHGGYTETHENFTPDIEVEEFDNQALNQYLSLMKVSDAELENLIQYFSCEEEDTIILFFGDHQPNDSIANPILRWNGVNTKTMTEEQMSLRYQVPYVMWANFDIAEAAGKDMDISFLGADLLKMIGIPLNAYQTFLSEYENVELEYEKAFFELVEQSDVAELDAKLDDYRSKHAILQYYFMFDYGNE